MAKTNAAVDLDNPDSWPDDIDELAELASGVPGDTPDKGEKAAEEKAEEPEAKSEEPSPKDKVTEDTKAESVPEESSSADKPDEGEEELPVSTKDGKNTIPYSVLKNERTKAAEANRRASELETKIAELEKQVSTKSDQGAEPERAAARSEFELTDEHKAAADKLREDWGDAIADQYIEMQRLQHTVRQQDAMIRDLSSKTASVSEAREKDEAARIQDAIDTVPQLMEWQSADDSTWFDRSVQMNAFLIANDPEYASKSWDERFAELPRRTLAAYGSEAPKETPATPAKPAVPAKPVAEAAKEAVERATSNAVPKSMSDLPTGSTPAEKTPVEKLETEDAATLTARMMSMSQDELDKFLANVM